MKRLLIIPILLSSLYGAQNTELLNDDVSVQKSKREAVFAFSNLSYETLEQDLPTLMCSTRGICAPLGKFRVKINPKVVDTLLKKDLPLLISTKFDKIELNKNSMEIITPRSNFSSELNSSFLFDGANISYKEFQKRSEIYLNSKIAPYSANLLKETIDTRYEDSSSNNVETFINTQAKELGIDVEALNVLMNSSYAFSFYMPKITGEILIRRVVERTKNGYEKTHYTTSLNIKVETIMDVYKFKDGKYVYYKSFTSHKDKSFGSALARNFGANRSNVTYFVPRQNTIAPLFESSFKSQYKDNIFTLSNIIKEDPLFSLNAPLTKVDGDSLYIDLGTQEAIRVNQPFEIYTYDLEGKSSKVGYAKVDSIGYNCLKDTQTPHKPSSLDLIKGDASQLDMAVEIPYSGSSISFDAFYNTRTFESDNADYGVSSGGALSFNGDIGYLSSSSAMRNFFMKLSFGFAYVKGGKNIGSGYSAMTLFGMHKKFDIKSGFFTTLGADLKFEYLANTFNDGNSGELYTSLFTINPLLGLGYEFSPYSNLKLSVGYDFALYSDYSTANRYYFAPTYDFKSKDNINFLVSYEKSLDFTGIFSGIIKNANTCDK